MRRYSTSCRRTASVSASASGACGGRHRPGGSAANTSVIQLERRHAGIDDVCEFAPAGTQDRQSPRWIAVRDTIQNRLTGSFLDAEELVQLVHFRPDLFPGLQGHQDQLAVSCRVEHLAGNRRSLTARLSMPSQSLQCSAAHCLVVDETPVHQMFRQPGVGVGIDLRRAGSSVPNDAPRRQRCCAVAGRCQDFRLGRGRWLTAAVTLRAAVPAPTAPRSARPPARPRSSA